MRDGVLALVIGPGLVCVLWVGAWNYFKSLVRP